MDLLVKLVVILSFVFVGFVLVYILFIQNKSDEKIDLDDNYFDLSNIIEITRKILDEAQTTDVAEYKLNHVNAEKKEKQKNKLRISLQYGILGDRGSKDYSKAYIQDVLQQDVNINAKTIDKVIHFSQPWKLSTSEKFLILYHIQNKLTPYNAFSSLCKTYNWDKERHCEDGIEYKVTDKDIETAFDMEDTSLNFPDKLEVLSQIIYQTLYGADSVDSFMFDESLDGYSAGCGGKTHIEYNYMEDMLSAGELTLNCYDTIYAMYKGVTIRMQFLSFHDLKRLQRVVKNIYRYDAKTPLNASTPIVKGHNMQNDRIMVSRPPVSASWCFYVRKFNSSRPEVIESLITDEGKERAISVLRASVRGGLSIDFTGDQSAGKTTLMKACIRFLGPTCSIRIAEEVFETHLNDLFPNMNIQIMQAYGDTSISDILSAYKQSDADITVLGEIRDSSLCKDLIEISQNGGKMTMLTSHHKTTKKLIDYFRNSLWQRLPNPSLAEQQVVDAINLDVHMNVTEDGHRFIERITEIVPYEEEEYSRHDDFTINATRFFKQMTQPQCYTLNVIIEYEDGVLKFKNRMSNQGLDKIRKSLSKEEYNNFVNFMDKELKHNEVSTLA